MGVANRMVVAAVALVGVFVATYLLLYNLGLVGSIVCGIGGGCETVQASEYAYFLGIPVAAWGLGGYLAILGVAMLGTQPALAEERWVGMTLFGLATVAFLFSLYLSALEQWVIGAWCRWCVVSAILATLIFVFSLPEIRRFKGDRAAG
ncbi:MAG TPA: vitamin K epoxide reductase family protein [Longimicrobiales bacterium]|nr:vitamin K epoxide reductase family protein [Longimicrobiales bacterium]